MLRRDENEFFIPTSSTRPDYSNSWEPLIRLNGGELAIQEKGLNAIKEEIHVHEASLAAFITIIGQCSEEDKELTDLVRIYLDCDNLNATNSSPRPFLGPQKAFSAVPSREIPTNGNKNSTRKFFSVSKPAEEDAVVVWSKALIHGHQNKKVAVFLIQIPSVTVSPKAYTKLADFCLLLSSLIIIPITRSKEQTPAWESNYSVLPKTANCDRACFQKLHFILRNPTEEGMSRFLNENEAMSTLVKSASWAKFSILKVLVAEVRFFSLQSLTQWGLWQYLRKILETDTLGNPQFSKPWHTLMGEIWKALYIINKPCGQNGMVSKDSGPLPDSNDIQIVEQLATEYMPKFERLKSVWMKILFLDASVLDYEFKFFLRQVMANFESKSVHGQQGQGDRWVENMLLAEFKREFDLFKMDYAQKHRLVSDGAKQLNEKLAIVEAEFSQSWEEGRMEEFLDQLSSKYHITMGNLDVSALDSNIMSQLQLYVAKSYASHESSIRKAAEILNKVNESMKEEFTNFMKDPLLEKLPISPEIPPIVVDGMANEEPVNRLVGKLVQVKYEKMVNIAREINQDADAKMKAAHIFIRDKAVEQFQIKVDDKPKSGLDGGDDHDGIPKHALWNVQLGSTNPIVLKIYSEYCNTELCS